MPPLIHVVLYFVLSGVCLAIAAGIAWHGFAKGKPRLWWAGYVLCFIIAITVIKTYAFEIRNNIVFPFVKWLDS